MNLRVLVHPALVGGGAGVAVAALGYAAAASQSASLLMPAAVYVFGGLTVFSLLAGTSSFNENSETPDPLVDQGDMLASPTESRAPGRLYLALFFLAVALSGVAGVALFG